MAAAILKLDRYWKLLNSDITWMHLVDLKSVEPVQKHVNKCEQRIIPEHNAIILLKVYKQPYQFEPERTLQEEDDSKWLRNKHSRETIIRISLEGTCMTSEHFSFLLSAFESGFRYSHNGSPPVIWIISLYLWYQVYFVIIILEFLVTVLRITYLRNIFWGWTVPLMIHYVSQLVESSSTWIKFNPGSGLNLQTTHRDRHGVNSLAELF